LLIALHKGLFGVVKASLTDRFSAYSAGLCASALAGGLKHKHLRFNRRAIKPRRLSLMLAAIGLLIPTVFHYAAVSGQGDGTGFGTASFAGNRSGAFWDLCLHADLFTHDPSQMFAETRENVAPSDKPTITTSARLVTEESNPAAAGRGPG